MPEVGTVKFFDARETKRFGFLRLESGEEIFFHFNDGQFIVAGGSYPEFSGKATIVRDGKTKRLRDPKVDDKLVFRRSMGSKGDKAAPWGYLTQWEATEQLIAKRPVYRVLEVMNSIGKEPGEPKVLWQGSDLSELMRRFPLPRHGQSPSADPLLPYYSDSDNIFEVRRWWEKQHPDGSWERCEDPRPLPGVLRQFEAISW